MLRVLTVCVLFVFFASVSVSLLMHCCVRSVLILLYFKETTCTVPEWN